MRPRTVVTLEQALSMPHATLRFAQLGWRVIRIESTPAGAALPGDPNRYIGERVAGDDRRSYFIAQNVGKEAIALNLKSGEGRAALHRIVERLGVDVFCCNTIPARYASLGIDPDTLRAIRPELVWAGISAMGEADPHAAGYDPVTQAMAGYMEVTGARDGPPTLAGIPVIDLKAGDEVYASVMAALLERAETGRGSTIHVSMLQAAASWLTTVLPLVDLGCSDAEITRAGSEHRKFVPTNAYPTRDGHILLAIGSDLQWRRLVAIDGFGPLANDARETNEGRLRERVEIHREIARITATRTTAELLDALHAAKVAATRIRNIREVRALPQLAGKLTRTTLPDGRSVHMQPMAVDVAGARNELPLAPRYGADTRSVLAQAGYEQGEIDTMYTRGIVA